MALLKTCPKCGGKTMQFSYEIMSHEPYICPECGYREGTAFDEAEEELGDA